MKSLFDRMACQAITRLFMLLGRVPLDTGRRLGAFLGHLIFVCDSKHREIALENLFHAFGREKGSRQIRELARRVFCGLGQILFEMGWFLRLEKKDFHKYFLIEGLSNLTRAYEKGKGVLILTAHMGNWELLTVVIAMTGYPASIVVRPLEFRPLEEFFIRHRTRFGGKLIPKKYSMRMVMKSLARREMVGMLMDQNVDWYDGVFVDFFGRPACTNKGLALLALNTGAPVVPVFLVRDKSCFKAEFGPEVPLVQTGDKTKDVEANTQQYTKVIESFIRRYPDQWFWVHQRWKTRPYHLWSRDNIKVS